MSFHRKKSKSCPGEEVEEKNCKNKSVMKGCPSLDLNLSLEDKDLKLHPFLNPTKSIKLNPPQAAEPQDGGYVILNEEPEYSCNFCPRKFSNKQALGGHQNAHKTEKVGLKRIRQGQIANFGSAGNGITSLTSPNSFNQDWKMMKGSHYPQYMEHRGHAHGYRNSIFPMPHESVVVQPFMGFGGFCTSPKHALQPQMPATGYHGSMFPVVHESGALQPFMGLSSFCTSTENPTFTSMERRIGPDTCKSESRFTAIEKNDEAGPYRQVNDTKIQHQEDDLNLLLKL